MSKKYLTAEQICAKARAMVGQYTYAQVDCIRVITNPLVDAGASFPLIGSNYFVRNQVSNLQRLTSASQLGAGKALFRSKGPSESGYALPARYEVGGSYYSAEIGVLDFHHIGLFVGNGEIVDSNKDSKRDGPALSTSWSAWEWVADIDMVDYESIESALQDESGAPVATSQAVVIGTGTSGVRFRQGPGKKYPFCAKISTIQEGELVGVVESSGEYTKVSYKGETGWVMSSFLTPVGEKADQTWKIVIKCLQSEEAEELARQHPNSEVRLEV